MKASPKGINSPDTADISVGMKLPACHRERDPTASGEKFEVQCFLQERARNWAAVSSPQRFPSAADKAALKLSENWLETL